MPVGGVVYVIYNLDYGHRDQHDPFEVYRLVEGRYVCQVGEPVWMPEINLGIGQQPGIYEGWEREWLYWYDQESNRFPSPYEQLEQERQLREALVARLRDRGIDLDDL